MSGWAVSYGLERITCFLRVGVLEMSFRITYGLHLKIISSKKNNNKERNKDDLFQT